jgi:hypothetical protein
MFDATIGQQSLILSDSLATSVTKHGEGSISAAGHALLDAHCTQVPLYRLGLCTKGKISAS